MEKSHFELAFVRAQKNFKPLVKNKINPHFKNTYADLTACFEATLPALNAENISVSQAIEFEQADGRGQMFLATYLIHETGSQRKTMIPIIGDIKTMQQLGSALTYARRYSFQAAVCISAEEDDDGNAAAKPEDKPEKPKEITKTVANAPVQGLFKDGKKVDTPQGTTHLESKPIEDDKKVSEAQLKRLFAISNAKGWTHEQCKLYIEAAFGLQTSKELAWPQYNKLISVIEGGSYVRAINGLGR